MFVHETAKCPQTMPNKCVSRECCLVSMVYLTNGVMLLDQGLWGFYIAPTLEEGMRCIGS